jgi:hypothetical protein
LWRYKGIQEKKCLKYRQGTLDESNASTHMKTIRVSAEIDMETAEINLGPKSRKKKKYRGGPGALRLLAGPRFFFSFSILVPRLISAVSKSIYADIL